MRDVRFNLIPPLEYGEKLIYWLVAAFLMLGALVYLAFAIYSAAGLLWSGDFTKGTLELLNGSLLALMLAQVVYTTINFLETGVLRIEPVIIVGIIAAVRRILVVTATLSAQERMLPPIEFQQTMIELAVLGGVALVMSIAIYLLRNNKKQQN